MEEVLEQGLRLAKASPVHVALRGTASAESVRCGWRGIARTAEQRANAIRYWLGLDVDEAVPDPLYVEILFTATLEVVAPLYLETAKSNFLAIARGGLSEEYLYLTCYADYGASEYLLGGGPTTLTVAYDRMDEAHSYELYSREHAGGVFGDDPLMSEGEYRDVLDGLVWAAGSRLDTMVGGRESILFLAPMGAHNAIALEAWQVVAQWDLQTVDGTVNAVRYGVSEYDPEYTQTLADLQSRITVAVVGDVDAIAYSERVGPSSVLRGHRGVWRHHSRRQRDDDLHARSASPGVRAGRDEPDGDGDGGGDGEPVVDIRDRGLRLPRPAPSQRSRRTLDDCDLHGDRHVVHGERP